MVDDLFERNKNVAITSGAYNLPLGTIAVSTIPRGELIGHGARTKTNLDAGIFSQPFVENLVGGLEVVDPPQQFVDPPQQLPVSGSQPQTSIALGSLPSKRVENKIGNDRVDRRKKRVEPYELFVVDNEYINIRRFSP